MGSKMVRDKQKSSEAVQASVRTNRGVVVDGLGTVLGPSVGEAAGIILDGSAARLAEATEAMVQADDAHLKELSDDADELTARDEAAARLYGEVCDFRDVGGTVYGDAYMRRLGFSGATPRDPVALDRLTTLLLDNVAATTPPPVRRKGIALDTAAWIAPLEESRKALSAALSSVATERREAEATQVAKNQAIAHYDQVFSVTATLVSALLSAADQKELARRVRPSTRRTGQTAEVAEAEEPGAGTAAGSPYNR